MKKQYTNESCDTQAETCSTTKGNKFTTVKTIYARIAVVLLALNFCLTGYVVWQMNKTTQAQIDGITETATGGVTARRATTTQQTPQVTESTGQGETTDSPVTTRDK